VDQASALLMQNWDHPEHIFKYLNLIPKDPHGCDFRRVRNWYLSTNAKYFRQTLVLGGFATPKMMKLFNQSMLNAAGRVKTQAEYAGSILIWGFKFDRNYPLPLLTQQFLLLTIILQTFTRIDPQPQPHTRRRLRLFHKSSPTLTPPKHLHKYINLHTELL